MKKIILLMPMALVACGGGSDFESTFVGPDGTAIKCETDYDRNYTRADTKCYELGSASGPHLEQPSSDAHPLQPSEM